MALEEQLKDAQAAYEAELALQWQLPEAQAARLLQLVASVFEAACAALQAEHQALTETEQEVARVLNSRWDGIQGMVPTNGQLG